MPGGGSACRVQLVASSVDKVQLEPLFATVRAGQRTRCELRVRACDVQIVLTDALTRRPLAGDYTVLLTPKPTADDRAANARVDVAFSRHAPSQSDYTETFFYPRRPSLSTLSQCFSAFF